MIASLSLSEQLWYLPMNPFQFALFLYTLNEVSQAREQERQCHTK